MELKLWSIILTTFSPSKVSRLQNVNSTVTVPVAFSDFQHRCQVLLCAKRSPWLTRQQLHCHVGEDCAIYECGIRARY